MKNFLIPFISSSVLVLSLCILPQAGWAQPGDPQTDPDLPIDGGVSILVAFGAAYGVKRIREERKKKFNKLP